VQKKNEEIDLSPFNLVMSIEPHGKTILLFNLCFFDLYHEEQKYHYIIAIYCKMILTP
jgi:hypothetical protein